jgi:hypothetical protein
MNDLDAQYQRAVHAEANVLLGLAPEKLINFPDYGVFHTIIAGQDISGGWWHYKLEKDVHHIYYQLERKVLLFFHKKYLAGIKICPNGGLALLSDKELGQYD